MNKIAYLDQLEQDSAEFRAQMIVAQLSMELAEIIKGIRISAGMSQKDLAIALETQQSRISKMESAADAHFTLMTLAKIADALDCTLKVELCKTNQPNALQKKISRPQAQKNFKLQYKRSQTK